MLVAFDLTLNLPLNRIDARRLGNALHGNRHAFKRWRAFRLILVAKPRIDAPMYLMNVPYSFSAGQANNVWMTEVDDEKRTVDSDKAMAQFLDLYHFIAADAVVYLLPAPETCGLQDLVFTANLGVVLEHLPDRDVAILSKMATEPREGEPAIGRKFFEGLGFEAGETARAAGNFRRTERTRAGRQVTDTRDRSSSTPPRMSLIRACWSPTSRSTTSGQP